MDILGIGQPGGWCSVDRIVSECWEQVRQVCALALTGSRFDDWFLAQLFFYFFRHLLNEIRLLHTGEFYVFCCVPYSSAHTSTKYLVGRFGHLATPSTDSSPILNKGALSITVLPRESNRKHVEAGCMYHTAVVERAALGSSRRQLQENVKHILCTQQYNSGSSVLCTSTAVHCIEYGFMHRLMFVKHRFGCVEFPGHENRSGYIPSFTLKSRCIRYIMCRHIPSHTWCLLAQ